MISYHCFSYFYDSKRVNLVRNKTHTRYNININTLSDIIITDINCTPKALAFNSVKYYCLLISVFDSSGKLIKIESYLESFPFPYYVVLRDPADLPETLADALRQWIEIIAGSS